MAEVEEGQAVQRRRDLGMVGAERLLPDHQRALVEWLGVGIAALTVVEGGQAGVTVLCDVQGLLEI
jgi:hypothetical protein